MQRVVLSYFLVILCVSKDCAIKAAENASWDNVGGVLARDNEIPWQAALQVAERRGILANKVWHHICGASVIKDTWLVTAAHCFPDSAKPADYRVVTGSLKPLEETSKTRQISKIAKLILHPQWKLASAENDIALILLENPLKLGPAVSHITLPKASDRLGWKDCVVVGWGGRAPSGPDSRILTKTTLPIVDNTSCVQLFRRLRGVAITPNKFCAGRVDVENFKPCPGDSGGAFACPRGGSHVLAGITSFTAGCGSTEFPTVFTRLQSYLVWIDQQLKAKH